MDADLLRRAAAMLREHASAATPGPWVAPNGWRKAVLYTDDGANYAYVLEGLTEDVNLAVLMHPPVALALAEFLDRHADFLDAHPDRFIGEQLAAVARAVLREEAGDDARH